MMPPKLGSMYLADRYFACLGLFDMDVWSVSFEGFSHCE
jgi:hypothetical protein